jgi:xanthine dehydrogenase YagR molybdenum-binding subunit
MEAAEWHHEATEIDRRVARYVNDNLADCLIPVNADVQDVDVILVPERDDFVNPVGVVKGIGELDNVGYRCGRCQRSLPRDRHSRPTTSDPA